MYILRKTFFPLREDGLINADVYRARYVSSVVALISSRSPEELNAPGSGERRAEQEDVLQLLSLDS